MERHLQALRRLTELLARKGAGERAIDMAHQVTCVEPLREEAYLRLIQLSPPWASPPPRCDRIASTSGFWIRIWVRSRAVTRTDNRKHQGPRSREGRAEVEAHWALECANSPYFAPDR